MSEHAQGRIPGGLGLERHAQRRAAGRVASPILSNIYLHKLDQFVETVLIPEYTRGKLRGTEPAYRKVRTAIARARRRGDRAEVRALRRQRAQPAQPGSERSGLPAAALRAVRRRHLLGFAGPKAEAEEIKQRLAAFLRDELKLELSQDKTLITHARTGAAVPRLRDHRRSTQNDKLDQYRRNRRSVNGTIGLRAQAGDQGQERPYLARGKPASPQPDRQRRRLHHRRQVTGPSTGASSSTTCWPVTSSDCTGCAGSWRPRCSRPWPQAPLDGDEDGGPLQGQDRDTARAAHVLRGQRRTHSRQQPLVARFGGIPLKRQKTAS